MAYYLELSSSGESLTLPLVGVYTGTIETYSGVITSISGTGQRVITGATLTQITKITATDNNGSHTYNPTLSAEAGGTLLIDEVGGNHGTLNGFSADPFVYYYDFLNPGDEDTTNDNCLVFDGVDDVVETNEHLDIDWSGEDWSIEWLSSEYANSGTFCAQNISGSGSSRELHVYKHSGNTLRFYVYGVNYITSVIPQQNVVYKLAYVNSTNTWSVYADGVFQLSGTLGSGTATEPTATFTIGARHNGSLTSYGYLAQVKLHYLKVEKGSTVHRFYDCNRSPATAPVVPELINGQNGTIIGGATYDPIIDTLTFTTGDYATLPLFVTAESSNSDYREYLAGTTAGATISGFSDGVIINGGTVTSPITLTQTGIAQIKNATCDDIDATGATGDVTIIDCEVEDVTS